ncbi:carboxymuconolactone decarboxylase family protein [Aeromicrobium ginsengisoli]|uniref:Carboxymuconolactone decarboxylase family protein n=1 Tax=Aeromicrobium ginsengisoli TaxID=363867 RepID=A0A5M4FGY1_9ACTN|nr:carboxymuconolactone decarboxylase family protein [Aeromicrobium ginsengisoli]KAA1399424.1 carboxymuconolactone decarboxylase family protein [Aeromicrobium ginsengisoli]
MQARMDNPAIAVPGAMEALHSLTKAVLKTGISPTTLELVNLRASQINGCSVCLQMHASDLRKAGETDEKIDTVAGWRDVPYFDDAERAALGLAEAVTRLSDQSDAVPDEVYDEAAAHYDEQQLGALILSIAAINVWNRVNVSTRQVAGAWG